MIKESSDSPQLKTISNDINLTFKLGTALTLLFLVLFSYSGFTNYSEITQQDITDGNEWANCLASYDNLNCHSKNDDGCKKLLDCLKEKPRDDVAPVSQRVSAAIVQTF